MVDGSIGGWRLRCILTVYIVICSLKTRVDKQVWLILGSGRVISLYVGSQD